MDAEQRARLIAEQEDCIKALHSLWFLNQDLQGVKWKPTIYEPLPFDYDQMKLLLELRKADIERLLEQE